jgi:hypothetical protein
MKVSSVPPVHSLDVTGSHQHLPATYCAKELQSYDPWKIKIHRPAFAISTVESRVRWVVSDCRESVAKSKSGHLIKTHKDDRLTPLPLV